MKSMARYGFILGLICLLAAGLLAIVNALTQPKIKAQAEASEQKTLLEVLPAAARFEAIKSSAGETLYYKAYDNGGHTEGIAFKATVKGYSSVIETMAGVGPAGGIYAIRIVSQNETPGVGTRIISPEFMAQFSGKNELNLNQVQAIAGATISSRAVINSVKEKWEEIRSLIKQ